MDRTALFRDIGSNHSITLYWVIAAVVGYEAERSAVRLRRLLWCEDVFLEETLADKLFQLLLEAPTMDGHMPLIVIIGAVFFFSVK